MIVLDASALVELILSTRTGQLVSARIDDPAESLHTPHLADLEVLQTLRRYVWSGEISAAEASAAIDDLRDLDVQRHAHEPLLDRIWGLRQNFTSYDAVYLALAEVLDGIVLTSDGRLSRAPGAAGRIVLVQAKGATR